jgi:phosphoribosylformimino-5-aminoimidazole carboxamide ribotide isomerase
MSGKETFTIYPAIDIRGGQCVRLYKGDYAQETVYGHPLDMASKWVDQGAQWIHLVDLDGAKEGKPVNDDLIVGIAKEVPVPVQIGGGIRDIRQVDAYLSQGVQRIILGTSAIKQPEFVKEALKEFGSHIVIGLDARNGYVATEGWLEASQVKTEDLALRLAEQGAETFIFTDISKDGTLTGPNLEDTVKLAECTGKEVIASGGVSTLKDLQELAHLRDRGVTGAIVGKALYQSVFNLEEAIQMIKEA